MVKKTKRPIKITIYRVIVVERGRLADRLPIEARMLRKQKKQAIRAKKD